MNRPAYFCVLEFRAEVSTWPQEHALIMRLLAVSKVLGYAVWIGGEDPACRVAVTYSIRSLYGPGRWVEQARCNSHSLEHTVERLEQQVAEMRRDIA